MRRTAAFLNGAAARRKGQARALPALLFFTDPQRTPDAEPIARTLPRGAAIVFRAFGAADAAAQGRRLRAIARARGLRLLVGADPELARALGADGLHLPERLGGRARAWRQPGWIVTSAAHSLAAARRAKAAGADAVVVSAIFPSGSPSAGAPMGPVRLALLARQAGLPVYALGGVNDKTARRLKDAGLVGLAAVDAFRT
ncbi:thiamine phosphate synthase [Phenylobacterium soli]|uniref:Thiamine monophosphate synthase n=1 Tax=Phenylobacterium soli TaxID=2170551 RepID=A0A328AGI2_9CAUL|nr:thiamine phosphate synthase [Phenylobacterium soli]RAK53625.1 thiamine monophosphate synthase [Phenylobacterium soli]